MSKKRPKENWGDAKVNFNVVEQPPDKGVLTPSLQFIRAEPKGTHLEIKELLRQVTLLASLDGKIRLALGKILTEDLSRLQFEGDKEGMESGEISRAKKAAEKMLHGLPVQYAARRESMAIIFGAVREEIAAVLEPAINAEAAVRPQATYDEKKVLAKWINAELRQFGLALRCPGIDQPCLLQAYQGNHPEIGRFRFDFVDAEGHRRQPVSSVDLPRLQLIPDDLMRAPYGERSQRRR